MVDRQVAKALADLVLFLEMSGDDILDPDAAVGAMERWRTISSSLLPRPKRALPASSALLRQSIASKRSLWRSYQALWGLISNGSYPPIPVIRSLDSIS